MHTCAAPLAHCNFFIITKVFGPDLLSLPEQSYTIIMRKSAFVLFSLLVACALSATVVAQGTLLLRNPSISQQHIAFVYGGDIWVADKSGQNPRRLTINPGVELNPVFSPDGQKIAFTGNYDGNTDVYIIPIQGGEPKRVTYHPGADIVRGWLDNDNVYFTTTREYQYAQSPRLYSANIHQGAEQALLMPEANQGSPSPDKSHWAYIKNTDPTERDRVAFKRYRGGGMPSVWIFNTKSHDVTIVPGENSNDVKPIWLGNTVYFLSDREKTVNIYGYDTKSKSIEKLTDFSDYDVRTLNGHDNELVFEQAGRLHILNLATKATQALAIDIHADVLFKRAHYVNVEDDIRGYNISATGVRALFESRGEIFSIPVDKGEPRNISNSPGTHERFPAWSPDGKWISYVSEARGKYELVLRDQLAKDEPTYIALGNDYLYFQPIWSPDSRKLFYGDAHLNLFYVDIDSKEVVKVDSDVLASTTGRTYNSLQPSWAPDSEWIAYTKTLTNGVSALFIYNIGTKATQQVTDGMSAVRGPVFGTDGNYLFFIASTNIGLTNSGLHMSAYDRSPDYNVYAVLLAKDTPHIIKTESDEEKVKEDKQASEKSDGDDKGEETTEKEKKDSKAVKIDFDGIQQRIVALPLRSGSYSLHGGVPNMLIYQRGGTIGAYNLKKNEDNTLVENSRGFAISADGKKMLYRHANGFSIVDAGKKPANTEAGKIKFNGAKQLVDPAAEWAQVYNEVWNLQKELFYVENMHGVDWEAKKAKYAKFLPYVNHRTDLGYLLNELMGEMVVGHNYIYPGDEPSTPSVSAGVLAADYRIVNGGYQVAKLYTNHAWNPSFKAPLAEPGLNIKEGDFIVAVNGVPVSADANIYSLFDHTVGKMTTLKINSKPSLDGAREVIVRPISYSDEMAIRQMDWVERNREKVDKLSNNQIAYVYMPNTGREGYNFFNRYYFSQMDKKALLLDERNNGGGSVADYVIDLLNRELIAGWKIRDGKSFTTPGNGIFGPKAMIINENAGSGGDMMPYMFRFHGLGKLIGRTTMGILVGISGYPPLLDGGRITSPNFGIHDLRGNYIIENEGVAPDIFVEQMPKDLLQGRDPQLERTIQLLLEEIKRYPYLNIVDPEDPIRVN